MFNIFVALRAMAWPDRIKTVASVALACLKSALLAALVCLFLLSTVAMGDQCRSDGGTIICTTYGCWCQAGRANR